MLLTSLSPSSVTYNPSEGPSSPNNVKKQLSEYGLGPLPQDSFKELVKSKLFSLFY